MNYTKNAVEEARKVADYIKAHPGCRIIDVERGLGMNQHDARYRYLCAVELGFVKQQKFRRGRPELREQVIDDVVELRRQNGTLTDIGNAMNISRQHAGQILKRAICLGKITEEEYKSAGCRPKGRKRWAYFLDLARHIEYVNRAAYSGLQKKYFGEKSRVRHHAIAYKYERACLDDLVENDNMAKEDVALMTWLLGRLKVCRLSLSQLKEFSKDAVKEGVTLKQLAVKYGLASSDCKYRSEYSLRCLRFAIELGLVVQDKYDAKARANKGPPRKYAYTKK